MKLRIVVADNNAAFLAEFVSVLAAEFEVVATAEDGKSALQCIRHWRPDVVVLDLEMPLLNGIDITKELSKHPPSPGVVICSVENDPEIIETARRAGARGYVFKARITRDLKAAVRAVASGKSFVSSS